MKRKAKPSIPDASSSRRRVLVIPMEELWTDAGSTGHVRLHHLSADEVDSLLKASSDHRLVEARIGEELRWHSLGDYRFWREKARDHAAEADNPRSLDEFPDSMFYFVSEWMDEESQDRVLLFEQYH